MLDQHRALIYTMIIVSAADSDMPDAELRSSATSSATSRFSAISTGASCLGCSTTAPT